MPVISMKYHSIRTTVCTYTMSLVKEDAYYFHVVLQYMYIHIYKELSERKDAYYFHVVLYVQH